MFTDIAFDTVDFPSCSSSDKRSQKVETSSQCEEITFAEVQLQVGRSKSEKVQADFAECVLIEEETSDQLLDFLKRTEPIITAQLQLNLQSHAFDDYYVNWEDSIAPTSTTKLHELFFESFLADDNEITCSSWNCSGSVVAVSYSLMDHEHWCSHKSFICSWNTVRRHLLENKPDVAIELPSCVVCLQFHPNLPSILAGGNFLGEILVWDLSHGDDTLVARSSMNGDTHMEPVSSVRWIDDVEGRSRGKFLLASSGHDGRILIWRIEKGKLDLQLLKGFSIKSEQLPRSIRSTIRSLDAEVGITDMCFNEDEKERFIISTESGVVFSCTMESNRIVGQSDVSESFPFYDPAQLAITAHDGPIFCLQASPFASNYFFSAGTDAKLKINLLTQDTIDNDQNDEVTPVLSIEPACGAIFSLCCSPTRPSVIAIGCEKGVVLVFDLLVSTSTPRVRLEIPRGAAIYSVQFNPKQSALLSAGDANGRVHIWTLDDTLTAKLPKEEERFLRLLGAASQ